MIPYASPMTTTSLRRRHSIPNSLQSALLSAFLIMYRCSLLQLLFDRRELVDSSMSRKLAWLRGVPLSAPPIRQVRVCGSLCALSSRRSLWLCSDSFQNGPYASVTILLGAASTHNGLGRSRDDSWERCRFILRFDSSHHRPCPPSRTSPRALWQFFSS